MKGMAYALSAGILLALVAVAFAVGRYPVSAGEVLSALFWQAADPTVNTVVMQVRGPRVLSALLVGAALAAAGSAYQGMFRNPLVSPDILGVSSGAALGAVLAIFLSLGALFMQLFAFAGGLAAVALVYAIGSRLRGHDPLLALVLTGVIIGTLLGSLLALLKVLADPYHQLPAITFWLLGSLAAVRSVDPGMDTSDVLAVEAAAREAVQRARGGGGPSLIESVSLRWKGHAGHDPATQLRNVGDARIDDRDADAGAGQGPHPRHQPRLHQVGHAGLAAQDQGLPILFDNIENSGDNQTRFLIVSKGFKNQPSGNDKTSILARIPHTDEPGSLFHFLQDFHNENINLTKIESRPAKKGKTFKYWFLIDFEGHFADENVKRVLDKYKREIKWLGSYVQLC